MHVRSALRAAVLDQGWCLQDRTADSIERCMAIQKLISVRQFAHQDSDPCWVLEGLYLGATLDYNDCHWRLRQALVRDIETAPEVADCASVYHAGPDRSNVPAHS